MRPLETASRPAYDLGDEFYDEAFASAGTPRRHYRRLLAGLEGVDLTALGRTIAADLHSRGVAFGTPDGVEPFVVDPIPRLVAADEWEPLAAGLAQRTRALNAFVADVYDERRIVAAGRVPARVVDTADHYEPAMAGVPVPGVHAAVAGLDVVRDADGRFKVLEDNVRTPSGLAYVEAARDVLDERLPAAAHVPKRSLRGQLYDALGATLRAAAHAGVGEPAIVLLSDGPSNSAWFEHRAIARQLAIPIVGLDDLSVRGGRLEAWIDGRERPVDVVYRRTDEDRLTEPDGSPTPVAAALLEPLCAGTLGLVNAFGPGVADDKLVQAYVEEMVRFYLGEEPLIESVRTYDLAEPEMREAALDRLDELVVKPRTGHGGYGVTICAHASRADVERVAEAIRARPADFVVQETVRISRHPTVQDGRLAPRHVDLRPFVLTAGEDVHVVPGGLTRVAFDPGSLVVNSSQNGGGKDTWVLE